VRDLTQIAKTFEGFGCLSMWPHRPGNDTTAWPMPQDQTPRWTIKYTTYKIVNANMISLLSG
jgi:hypothetical protein